MTRVSRALGLAVAIVVLALMLPATWASLGWALAAAMIRTEGSMPSGTRTSSSSVTRFTSASNSATRPRVLWARRRASA